MTKSKKRNIPYVIGIILLILLIPVYISYKFWESEKFTFTSKYISIRDTVKIDSIKFQVFQFFQKRNDSILKENDSLKNVISQKNITILQKDSFLRIQNRFDYKNKDSIK